jgi:hypothetical protein
MFMASLRHFDAALLLPSRLLATNS